MQNDSGDQDIGEKASDRDITSWKRPQLNVPIAEEDENVEIETEVDDSIDPEAEDSDDTHLRILNLPEQIRQKIYNYIPDLRNLRLTCRFINDEIEDEIPLCVGLYERGIRFGVLDLTRKILVSKLAIGYLPSVTLPNDFLRSPSSLRELSIFGLTSAKNITMIIEKCRYITRLVLDFGAIDKTFLFGQFEPSSAVESENINYLPYLNHLDISARSLLGPRNEDNFYKNIKSILKIPRYSLRTLIADFNSKPVNLANYIVLFFQCIIANIQSLKKIEIYLGHTLDQNEILGIENQNREISRTLNKELVKISQPLVFNFLSIVIQNGVGLDQWSILLDKVTNMEKLTMDLGSACPTYDFYYQVILHSSQTLTEICLENLRTRHPRKQLNLAIFSDCSNLSKLVLSQWRAGDFIPISEPVLGDIIHLDQLPNRIEHLSLSRFLIETAEFRQMLGRNGSFLKVFRVGFYKVEFPVPHSGYGIPLDLVQEIVDDSSGSYSQLREFYLSYGHTPPVTWCTPELKAYVTSLNEKNPKTITANHHDALGGCFIVIIKELDVTPVLSQISIQ